jgi:phospholipid/cholesterol/gamma-HCH transport system permease protein
MWFVLPFVYITAIAVGFIGSYIAVVDQVAQVSPGGYWQLFWQFQNPGDLLFSAIKGMSMATVIVLTAVYYGYFAGGGPVGVGKATAKSMIANVLSIHVIGMLGSELFWGGHPRAPIGG